MTLRVICASIMRVIKHCKEKEGFFNTFNTEVENPVYDKS
jgi:hypothetical protein